MASGAFPLLEVEDGVRWTVNSAALTRLVADYWRCSAVTAPPAADVAALQGEIDEGWARLVRHALQQNSEPRQRTETDDDDPTFACAWVR